MALLELNLRAKKEKKEPPPAPPTADGVLTLQVGKKYISNENMVVGPMEAEDTYVHFPWVCAPYSNDMSQKTFHWEIQDGIYVGQEKTHKRSIRREWTPTWELEEAWMRGEKLEYFESVEGVWRLWNPYSYTLIQNTFGKGSITTKDFWEKSYAYQCIREDGTFRVRIKPVA
jgi:hypothetical protein